MLQQQAPAAYQASLTPEDQKKERAKRRALAKKLFGGHYSHLRGMRGLRAMAMLQLEGMGLASVVCRVRVALSVARETQPTLRAHIKAGPVFTKYAKELKPLLACAEDKAKSDRQCEGYLFGLMFDADKIMPEVKRLQKKLGKAYKAAAAWGCKPKPTV